MPGCCSESLVCMPARSVMVQGPGKCCGRTVCTFPWIYPRNECLDCSYPPHHSGTSVLRSLCSSLESRLPVGAACNGFCQTRTSLKWEKEGESTPFTPVSNFSTVTFCVFLSTCICDLTSPLWSKHHTYPCLSSPLPCSGTFPSAASLVFWISAHLSPSPSKPFPYF